MVYVKHVLAYYGYTIGSDYLSIFSLYIKNYLFFLCLGNYIGSFKLFAGSLRGDRENGEPHSNMKSSTTGP